MRRIFDQRARLVVYVESGDADRMEKLARGEGKTLVEWMRETLLRELEDNSGLPRPTPVRVAERGASAPERAEKRTHRRNGGTVGAIEDVVHETVLGHAKTCKHGVAKSFRCWQCGGLAIIE